MSILKQAINNTTLVMILACLAVLMPAGCQDSGADGFVHYSETEPVPAVSDSGADGARDAAPASPSPADTSVQCSADRAEDAITTSRVPDGEKTPGSTAAPITETVAAADRSAANIQRAITPGDATDQGDSTEDEIAASPVSARSAAMAEMARQRAATLAAYGGERFANGVDAAAAELKAANAEPREVKLLIPDKRLRTEGDSGALRVSYDDIDLLQILNMEPVPVDAVDHFPDWLNKLDGQKIRIRGFMYPTFQATGLTAFTLARDNGICCFVRQPKIYDIIGIRLAEGEETDYIEGKPFDVEGTFHIVPEADETELYQLYRIEDAKVLH